ncbi:MAG: hypothetical protein JOY96_08805 [Verrucomicrobia bacterium]|nr:hypothetical protein [Verrucomicrobiota bacterium]MBV9674135.1 hypothetical protein [Verrucomicrobiota bacterium]
MKGSFEGRGTLGNVLAALASFFLPGLGQLAQGRVTAALFYFVLTSCLWIVTFGFFGWIGHFLACLDAALWEGRR